MPMSGKEDEFRIGFLAAIEVPERGYVGGLLVTNRFGRPLEFQCTTPVKPNRTQEILYGPTLVPFVLGELIGRTLVEKIGVRPHLVLTENSEIMEVRNHVSLPVAFLDDADSADTDAVETIDDVDEETFDVAENESPAESIEPQSIVAAAEPPVAECPSNCSSTESGETFVASTCTALSIIRIDSDNLSRAIAAAAHLTPMQPSPEQHTELNIPVTMEQPAAAPEPAAVVESPKKERKPRAAARREPVKPCIIGKQRLRFHAAHLADQESVEQRVASLPKDVDLREPFERIREALEETIRSGSSR